MRELLSLSMVEAVESMKKGDFTAKELVTSYLTRIDELNAEINAFITVTHDLALRQAESSDRKIQKGEGGIIEGIPIGIKDLFCTEGVKTTAASKMLCDFTPYYESTVTNLLYQNGGISLGKTNMDEFAMGSSNKTSYFGHVKSPWKRKNDNIDLVPGGSSGGSAAAIAAKMSLGTIGSDTGGSVRQPASFCGVVGVKPTYGRCSRFGMIGFASSLDQAGVFTRNVKDAALLLESICGYDDKDSTSVNIETPKWSQNLNGSVKGLRIGIPKEYVIDGMKPDIIKMWESGKDWLRSQGAEIVEVSLPNTKYALPTYYVIAPSEASSNLARFDGVRYGLRVNNGSANISDMIAESRAAGFGSEVKRRLMIGTYLLSAGHYDAHYLRAQKVRRIIYNDFLNVFQGVDAILTPTTPSTAFGLNEGVSDPVTMYLNDILTVTVNLAGLPGISVPAALGEDGLPLGLQVISRAYDEVTLFQIAYALEKAANFKAL
ncbi:Asp-tRNA(Asn)/Glu-tRNA(Gln) amidotransferase subunit GatA [Candidatus Lariskella endosymbiont of Epinotia ramella]|uniref:Asp-tRNA(Asn)/Glu-tRNA(Gln) amidotransferase subunit GatA n=1 Tax=Candidatus Lariskella endosymbiont of Epinotia ramella TaxID=3066224 RepID=UPI0030CADE5F